MFYETGLTQSPNTSQVGTVTPLLFPYTFTVASVITFGWIYLSLLEGRDRFILFYI